LSLVPSENKGVTITRSALSYGPMFEPDFSLNRNEWILVLIVTNREFIPFLNPTKNPCGISQNQN
jgi:hypothetical protein